MSPTLVYATTFSTLAGSLTSLHEANARAEAQKNKVLNLMVNQFGSERKDRRIFSNIVNFVADNNHRL